MKVDGAGPGALQLLQAQADIEAANRPVPGLAAAQRNLSGRRTGLGHAAAAQDADRARHPALDRPAWVCAPAARARAAATSRQDADGAAGSLTRVTHRLLKRRPPASAPVA